MSLFVGGVTTPTNKYNSLPTGYSSVAFLGRWCDTRNTREKAAYSTFSVSNAIFGGFLEIKNLGSFGHSLGRNLTYPKIVDFITL
jgi:hypothetical protein